MRQAVLFLNILLLSIYSFAELGFHLSMPGNPNINNKKEAVYKAYFPAPPMHVVPAEQLGKVDLDALERQFGSGNDEGEQVSFILARKQILEYLKNIDQDCIIYSGHVRGTLFFSGDQRTIYTAYHNIEGIITGQFQTALDPSQQTTISQQLMFLGFQAGDVTKVNPFDIQLLTDFYKEVRLTKSPIVIFNSDDDVVFGDLDEDQVLSLDFKPEVMYQFYGVEILKAITDFARITLNRDVGTNLSVASEGHFSERLTAAGYPIQTDRSMFDRPSSDGRSLYFSTGTLLDGNQIQKRTGVIFSGTKKPNQYLDQITFCDCDAAFGNSGGPAFNQDGEVLFILTNILPFNSEKLTTSNNVSFGPQMSYVLKYFETLDEKLQE